MSIFWYTLLIDDLEFTTPCVGLRPRVYYTVINFRGGKAPLPPPLNTPMLVDAFLSYLHKKSIGHLLRTSQDYFRPPPRFREEMDSIYVHFRRVLIC